MSVEVVDINLKSNTERVARESMPSGATRLILASVSTYTVVTIFMP